jgi:hypothetical protein
VLLREQRVACGHSGGDQQTGDQQTGDEGSADAQ